MKKISILHNSLLMAGAAFVLSAGTACSDGRGFSEVVERDHGTVSFRALSIDVDTDTPDEGRAIDPSVDVSNYIVELVSTAADGAAVGTWTYADMPEIQVLPVGGYKVNVISHEAKDAAFDEPLYVGSETFSVVEAEVHNVGTVVCTLANIKVSVRYSDALAAIMDPSSSVTVEAANTSLQFMANEDRAGYFRHIEGASTLVATFNGLINGNTETLRKVLDDVKPGHHYILTYDVKTASVGGGFAAPSVDVDASVDGEEIQFTVDPGDDKILDGSDRPGGNGGGQNPPSGDGKITFTSSQLSFTEENSTSVAEAVVLIHSDEGIAKLEVDIISDQLTDEMLSDVGLAAHFDLAHPGDFTEALEGLGFKTGNDVIGKNDITFDITQFMTLLDIYEGVHKFKITVTDAAGNADSRTLSFKVVK